ncbi:hypothetical protein P153DRAFT_123306 [Dothidotthia symphoricarpi CBS 119687]|uniref:Uncharacterized protein n=1 Tax=Dothidotthia symphoricarpi CBS 119687 TaxID=1392245 RepID=A0A6A6A042_9PLEO|nr:uncharacterized protein P153DRAFT_123306 [Dothidotthia symphoricarpi CBS 119687]KAF2124625.1 hypothetical protein P153DRAFT_123306 [Dothidotthia symphoricarpi CBS 119687]
MRLHNQPLQTSRAGNTLTPPTSHNPYANPPCRCRTVVRSRRILVRVSSHYRQPTSPPQPIRKHKPLLPHLLPGVQIIHIPTSKPYPLFNTHVFILNHACIAYPIPSFPELHSTTPVHPREPPNRY